jgi:hypothetical protein
MYYKLNKQSILFEQRVKQVAANEVQQPPTHHQSKIQRHNKNTTPTTTQTNALGFFFDLLCGVEKHRLFCLNVFFSVAKGTKPHVFLKNMLFHAPTARKKKTLRSVHL